MRRAATDAVLLVMFLLELGVIAGAAWWGFTLPAGPLTRAAAGVLAPAVFIAMWALFGAAADARFPLTGGWRVALECVWFGGGAIAYAAARHPLAGIAFAGVWAVNALARVLTQGTLTVRMSPREKAIARELDREDEGR